MKHLYENLYIKKNDRKYPKKNEEIIKEYEKLISYYKEPIENYKVYFDSLKNQFEELKINYRKYFIFFENNFNFKEKIESGFFSNKKFEDISYKNQDKLKLFELLKIYSKLLEKIEHNYLVYDSSLFRFKNKIIGDSDEDYIDLKLSNEIDDAFELITPFGKIDGIFSLEIIDNYNAKKKINNGLISADYCTPKTKSFFEEYLKCLYRVKVPVPTILSEKGVKNFYQVRVEYYEKQKRKYELIARRTKKGKEKMDNVGYVYVLSNEAYPNIYKIGSTYGLPEERAEELTGTGHLKPFKVVGKTKIQSAEYYEKSIHKLLKNYRVKQGREFFKLDLSLIKNCLKQVSEISEKGTKKITFAKMQKEIELNK